MFIHLRAQRPMKGKWAPRLRSFGVWTSFTFTFTVTTGYCFLARYNVGLSVVLFVGPYAEIVKLDTSKIVTTWKLRGQWQENKKIRWPLRGRGQGHMIHLSNLRPLLRRKFEKCVTWLCPGPLKGHFIFVVVKLCPLGGVWGDQQPPIFIFRPPPYLRNLG